MVAGAGANSTAEAVHLTKWSMENGADAVLSVNPYYNKPTQVCFFGINNINLPSFSRKDFTAILRQLLQVSV